MGDLRLRDSEEAVMPPAFAAGIFSVDRGTNSPRSLSGFLKPPRSGADPSPGRGTPDPPPAGLDR